jgi:hypothetical protein
VIVITLDRMHPAHRSFPVRIAPLFYTPDLTRE